MRQSETFDPAAALICYTETMFLQTLVQLNILILATPALAGWTLMPLAQPGAVRAACVVWQGRTVEEAVAPKLAGAVQTRVSARPKPLVVPRLTTPEMIRPVVQSPTFSAAPTAACASFNPFPHATRAP